MKPVHRIRQKERDWNGTVRIQLGRKTKHYGFDLREAGPDYVFQTILEPMQVTHNKKRIEPQS